MRKAILKTLTYADIFSYPLKFNELWQFLIWDNLGHKASKAEFKKSVKLLLKSQLISQKDGFFCLRKREGLIERRRDLEKTNKEKLILAKGFVNKIKVIPWVKAVLATGALAVSNTKEDDDIDLFIITTKNRLWLARFGCILIAEILGIRRRPNQKKVKNKICLNLFLAEDNLEISPERRNLFSAHEVIQARPIFEKEEVYKKFLNVNLWVKEYLPNGIENQKLNIKNKKPNLPAVRLSSPSKSGRQEHKLKNKKITHYSLLITHLLNFLETLAYKLQLSYMRSKKTTERISPSSAFFHPKDIGKTILANYKRKIKHLGV